MNRIGAGRLGLVKHDFGESMNLSQHKSIGRPNQKARYTIFCGYDICSPRPRLRIRPLERKLEMPKANLQRLLRGHAIDEPHGPEARLSFQSVNEKQAPER